MEWTDEKCLTLIELYHKYPVLWDPNDLNYKKKSLKGDAWKEIGDIMDLPADVCKNKMVILLSGFRREKIKCNRGKGTGKGASDYKSQWFAFNTFASFLINRDEPQQILKTETTEDLNIDEFETEEVTQVPKRSKLDSKHDMLKQTFNILKTVASKSDENDEIGSFCKFVCNKLRNYDIRTKNWVQHSICNVLFKADSGYTESYQTGHQQYQQIIEAAPPLNNGDFPEYLDSPANSPSRSHSSSSSFNVGDYV